MTEHNRQQAASITRNLAGFAFKTRYEDLPGPVIREAKKILLDTIGCAVGGIATKKGGLALRMARMLAGPPQASLLGTGEKVSVSASAYATGEWMNALDYEALLCPPDHATPYILAAILAAGEAESASGREIIVATAVAHEMALRIGAGLVFGSRFNVELPERRVSMSLPTPGYGLCIFGGTAATGRLLGLSEDQIAHAMGIAGYHAPVPMLMKFATTVPAGMPKYLSSGMLSCTEVMAAQAARLGCTGDPEVLDGPYGFWRAFGCEEWRPEIVSQGLGDVWYFPERIFYKAFPCCGAMQNGLALFRRLVTEKDLRVEDIEELHVKMNMLAELPVWRAKEVVNHIDAQFNVPFVFSLVANRVEVGPAWQSEETLRDPEVLSFMKKVTVWTDLDEGSRSRPDIEVMLGAGSQKRIRGESGAVTCELDEAALREKFLGNTRALLGKDRAKEASEKILNIEAIDDLGELTNLLLFQ